MLYYPPDMRIPEIIYHIASVIRGQCTSLLYRVVGFRQRPHALPPTRHENSGDHIPHRKWDSRTVYVSSSSSCGFSTEALCYYPSDMRIPVSYIAISTWSAIHRPNNEQHFLFIELWERHISPVRHENSGVIYCHIYTVRDSQTEQ